MNRPRFVDTPGGVSLEFRGRFLYSRQDPRKGPERIAGEVPLKANSLYLVPSPLLGYGLNELVKRLPADALLLCLEPEDELFRVSREAFERAPYRDDKRIVLLDTIDPEEIYRHLVEHGYWPYRRIELIRLNGGYSLFKAGYDALRDELDTRIRLSYQDRITKVFLARRWLKNLFTNLGSDLPLDSFRSLATEKPVLVAGAGESLEAALPEIKRWRKAYYLLACDTALPVLSSCGIVPDAAVVLEAQFINLRDFYRSPLQEIDLLADLTSYPAVFRLPWRRRYAFASRFAELNALNRLFAGPLSGFEFEAYGSVGIAAVALARKLSSQAVYLSGIDFCYRLGKSHARGNQFHLAELAECTRLCPPGELSRFFQRPLVRRAGKESEVLSDLILLNYRESFFRLSRVMDGLFDLNPAGLDLGLPLAEPGPPRETIRADLQPGSSAKSLNHDAAQKFIEDEDKYLALLLEEGRRYLSEGTQPHKAFPFLKEHDFLYAHFPEEYREYPLDPTSIKRLLIAAEGYRAHFRTIRTGSR